MKIIRWSIVLVWIWGLRRRSDSSHLPVIERYCDDQMVGTTTVEVANTDALRRQWLMHRRQLDDGHGMLFVFEQEALLDFWMRNTLLPLDMIFVKKDKTIWLIHRGALPWDETSISSRQPSQFVVEVMSGQAQHLWLKKWCRMK